MTVIARARAWRRALQAVGAVGVSVGLIAAGPAAGAHPATQAASPASAASSIDATRAARTYQAMQKYLYIPKYHLYQSSDNANLFSYLWDFDNAYSATDYLAGMPNGGSKYRTDLAARDAGLAAYYDADETDPSGAAQPPAYASGVEPPLGNGGTTFYDDNAWVGLDAMYQYRLTGQKTELAVGEDIFKYAVSGWDNSTTDACPGGVYWEDSGGSPRNTVSNGPNAEVGLMVYQATGDSYYLQWAEKMYDWVRTCLLAPNGMYYDHLNSDSTGAVNTAEWTYNQGVMIGAGVLLYQATGDQTYLQQAEQTATSSMSADGTVSALDTQPDVFDVIFFRNLFYLAQFDHNPAYRQLAASYANAAWTGDRQVTGLFDDPDPNGGESLVNQTAPMAELYALLAGSPPLG